jgi:trk system potassium uptake protein TrkA
MNYIVVGCGRVGAELAYSLYIKGHKVSIIDQSASAFNNLHPDFRGRIIEGDSLNQDVLERAGIGNADGLATLTNSDPLNAVVAHIARIAYDVPRVIARNYDPGWRALHEAFSLQFVSSSTWGAQRIEALLEHPDINTIYSVGNGEVVIFEFLVPDLWDGKELGSLIPEGDCSPITVTHAGKSALSDRGTVLHAGDVVLASATLDGIQALRQQLIRSMEGI